MKNEHDPYACPFCLAIGRAATKFPTVIRIAFVTLGILTSAIADGTWPGILIGSVAGLVAAELFGAAAILAVRVWMRRTFAKFDDPVWRESVDRYLVEVRQRQRWSRAIYSERCDIDPVGQYPKRR